MRNIYHLLFIICSLLLVACQDNENSTTDSAITDTIDTASCIVDSTLDTTSGGPSYFERKAAQVTQPAAKKNTTTKKTTATQRTNKSKGETIYVETFGAQGKVWGHVTMYGDKGKGTIHDGEMNNFNVTVYRRVTRGKEELLAIDQNSRQYVFKL